MNRKKTRIKGTRFELRTSEVQICCCHCFGLPWSERDTKVPRDIFREKANSIKPFTSLSARLSTITSCQLSVKKSLWNACVNNKVVILFEMYVYYLANIMLDVHYRFKASQLRIQNVEEIFPYSVILH